MSASRPSPGRRDGLPPEGHRRPTTSSRAPPGFNSLRSCRRGSGPRTTVSSPTARPPRCTASVSARPTFTISRRVDQPSPAPRDPSFEGRIRPPGASSRCQPARQGGGAQTRRGARPDRYRACNGRVDTANLTIKQLKRAGRRRDTEYSYPTVLARRGLELADDPAPLRSKSIAGIRYMPVKFPVSSRVARRARYQRGDGGGERRQPDREHRDDGPGHRQVHGQ